MPRRKQTADTDAPAAAITPELRAARAALNRLVDTDASVGVAASNHQWVSRLVSPLERPTAAAAAPAADASDTDDDEDAVTRPVAARAVAAVIAPAKADEALDAMVAQYQAAVRSDNEMTEFRARQAFYTFLKERGNEDYFDRKAIVDQYQDTAFQAAAPAAAARTAPTYATRASAPMLRNGARIAEEAPEDLTPLRKGEKPTLSWVLGRSRRLRQQVRNFNADYGTMSPEERSAAQEALLTSILEHCPNRTLADEFTRNIVADASKDIGGHERAQARVHAHGGVSTVRQTDTFPRPVGLAVATAPDAKEKEDAEVPTISPSRMQEIKRGRPLLGFAMCSFIRCYAAASEEHRTSMTKDITAKLSEAKATDTEVTAIIAQLKEQALSERHAGLGRK